MEELKIGEPMPASVGILNIGSVKVFGLTIKLSDLFSGISVITPSIYDYKTSYKIEGRWALGDSLNIAGSCNSDDKPKWCKNPIIKIIMKSINKSTDKAGQDAYDKAINDGALEEDAQRASNDAKENYLKECPLLNLLHQMGSN